MSRKASQNKYHVTNNASEGSEASTPEISSWTHTWITNRFFVIQEKKKCIRVFSLILHHVIMYDFIDRTNSMPGDMIKSRSRKISGQINGKLRSFLIRAGRFIRTRPTVVYLWGYKEGGNTEGAG